MRNFKTVKTAGVFDFIGKTSRYNSVASRRLLTVSSKVSPWVVVPNAVEMAAKNGSFLGMLGPSCDYRGSPPRLLSQPPTMRPHALSWRALNSNCFEASSFRSLAMRTTQRVISMRTNGASLAGYFIF
jgi:hypothetical protein